MRATVIRGKWSWLGKMYRVGDEVEATEPQIRSWEADGLVERIAEPEPKPQPKPEPKAVAEIESAAIAPEETATLARPRRRRRGGS
jgi:hypothetical protein